MASRAAAASDSAAAAGGLAAGRWGHGPGPGGGGSRARRRRELELPVTAWASGPARVGGRCGNRDLESQTGPGLPVGLPGRPGRARVVGRCRCGNRALGSAGLG